MIKDKYLRILSLFTTALLLVVFTGFINNWWKNIFISLGLVAFFIAGLLIWNQIANKENA